MNNLLQIAQALLDHAKELAGLQNPNPDKVSAITDAANTVDGEIIAEIQAIKSVPAPTGKLDFSAFDSAVSAFKADGKLSQSDVDAVTRVLTINTPQ